MRGIGCEAGGRCCAPGTTRIGGAEMATVGFGTVNWTCGEPCRGGAVSCRCGRVGTGGGLIGVPAGGVWPGLASGEVRHCPNGTQCGQPGVHTRVSSRIVPSRAAVSKCCGVRGPMERPLRW